MWSDSSFWSWFAFARWLVMLTKFAGAHWPSVCLPWKNSICILCPFLSWFVYFCYYVVWVFKNISWMLTSLDIWFENISLNGLPFHAVYLMLSPLPWRSFLVWQCPTFLFLLFLPWLSVSNPKKWSRTLSRRYCLCFLLGVLWFQVLCSRLFTHL